MNDLGAHADLVEAAATNLGDVRAVVLAAGVFKREPFEDVSEAAWDWQLDTNLKSTFFLARVAGEHMRQTGADGSICTFSSLSGTTGGPSSAPAYASSKGGIISLTYAMARHFGPHGIRVNSIAPGIVDTPMQRADLRQQRRRSSRARHSAAKPIQPRWQRSRSSSPPTMPAS